MTYKLVINAGSLFAEIQLIDIDKEEIIAKGICERIATRIDALLQAGKRESFEKESPMKTHEDAISSFLKCSRIKKSV